MNRKWIALAVGAGCLLAGGSVLAQEGVTVAIAFYSLDNIVLLFSAVLVLFMQAGFAALESGMSPLNNTVNIMFKNFTDLCVGVLLFYTVGYSIMYGPDASGGLGLFGWDGFGISAELSSEPGPGVIHPQVDWLFQVAFAATAATIVSGAVVGRMQFRSYVYYSLFITALVYPISGFWKWGGGWLDQLGFYDFAGSIVVHAVGGFAALAAAMVIGPRIGRFNDDPEAPHLAGHSLATASLGVFILWIGWFGFNPGSQLAFSGEANIAAIMLIAVNTTLAAAAGAIAAMITSSILAHSHRVSLSMLLNGALAGLVGITANCDSVTNNEAIVIGLVAGIPLPILNANKRAIAEARIDRELARAAFEIGYESLVGRHSVQTTRATALRAELAEMERVLVPMVDDQISASLRLLDLGEGTSLVLFESLTGAHAIKLDYIDLWAAEVLARAELEHLTGPAPSDSAIDSAEESP